MKKITLATIKSFINKNRNNLFINVQSSFNGMTDGVDPVDGGFESARATDHVVNNTLGIVGAWFVKRSNDYFTAYDDGKFVGYEVYNSCGTFVIALEK